jgi:hypothetical protein
MYPISYIINLIGLQPNFKRRHFVNIDQGVNSMEERVLSNFRMIEASDLFLREIEYMVNENIDFNKDKYKIQSLLNKFEEIELELNLRYESTHYIKFIYERHLSRTKSNQRDYSEHEQSLNSEIEDAKKILNLIIEIRERKRKVEKRLKEIGIKLCFRMIFLK